MAPIAPGATLVAAFALLALTASGSNATAPSKRVRAHHAHAAAHHHHPRHPRVAHDHSVAPPAPHHPRVVTFVDGYEQPVIPTPYPFDGRLAGDGILGTGILDTNVLRAYGFVRN